MSINAERRGRMRKTPPSDLAGVGDSAEGPRPAKRAGDRADAHGPSGEIAVGQAHWLWRRDVKLKLSLDCRHGQDPTRSRLRDRSSRAAVCLRSGWKKGAKKAGKRATCAYAATAKSNPDPTKAAMIPGISGYSTGSERPYGRGGCCPGSDRRASSAALRFRGASADSCLARSPCFEDLHGALVGAADVQGVFLGVPRDFDGTCGETA